MGGWERGWRVGERVRVREGERERGREGERERGREGERERGREGEVFDANWHDDSITCLHTYC